MFTSIPPNETIDLAVKLIFDNNPNIKITKKDFKKLFEFATSGAHILFEENYYDQIDDFAMGSPIARKTNYRKFVNEEFIPILFNRQINQKIFREQIHY